jgi:hypothetical protein
VAGVPGVGGAGAGARRDRRGCAGGGGGRDRGRGAGRAAAGAVAAAGRGAEEGGGCAAGVSRALRGLLEAATRGDPVAEITWCSLSLRELERQVAGLGFRCGKDALARMIRGEGCSLQGPHGRWRAGSTRTGTPSSADQRDDRGVHGGGGSGGLEHRLFCHITRTWRGRPLMTPEDAVAGIAATTTYAGLKVTAVLDGNQYPKGQEIADERMKYLEERILDRGERDYVVRPPGPPPDLIRNQPRSRPGAAPGTS